MTIPFKRRMCLAYVMKSMEQSVFVQVFSLILAKALSLARMEKKSNKKKKQEWKENRFGDFRLNEIIYRAKNKMKYLKYIVISAHYFQNPRLHHLISFFLCLTITFEHSNSFFFSSSFHSLQLCYCHYNFFGMQFHNESRADVNERMTAAPNIYRRKKSVYIYR